jgi:hypothetical protein
MLLLGKTPPFFCSPHNNVFFSRKFQMAGNWISKLAKRKEQYSQTEPAPKSATMKDGW